MTTTLKTEKASIQVELAARFRQLHDQHGKPSELEMAGLCRADDTIQRLLQRLLFFESSPAGATLLDRPLRLPGERFDEILLPMTKGLRRRAVVPDTYGSGDDRECNLVIGCGWSQARSSSGARRWHPRGWSIWNCARRRRTGMPSARHTIV